MNFNSICMSKIFSADSQRKGPDFSTGACVSGNGRSRHQNRRNWQAFFQDCACVHECVCAQFRKYSLVHETRSKSLKKITCILELLLKLFSWLAALVHVQCTCIFTLWCIPPVPQ